MEEKSIKCLKNIFTFFFIINIIVSIQTHLPIENERDNSNFTISLAPLAPSGPINIINDNNFTDYGFVGTGSSGDPYRIENFNITTSSTAAISIIGTTKYFVIFRCR